MVARFRRLSSVAGYNSFAREGCRRDWGCDDYVTSQKEVVVITRKVDIPRAAGRTSQRVGLNLAVGRTDLFQMALKHENEPVMTNATVTAARAYQRLVRHSRHEVSVKRSQTSSR
jgi:hypothetical protein